MKKRADTKDSVQKQDGFIALILIFIIALALLKYYFNWSIFEATATPQGQETVSYTRHLLDTIWYYLQAPVSWIWNNIIWPVLGFLWRAFQNLITSAN